MAIAETFDTWPEAFDACREANRPLVVCVDGEVAKIFPSGHSTSSTTAPPGSPPAG